jgi:C-terminal processing protease CtpA/Prc
MVNNRTASASEIVSNLKRFNPRETLLFLDVKRMICVIFLQVASALHDNCKAVLVGERTYGKVIPKAY